MPRIRTFKPEYFTSPSVAQLDPLERLLYMAMWSWADDFGIGETNINGLIGFAFPDTDGITAPMLRRFCANIARVMGVTFYTVRGRHYYAVPNWEQHQKLERRTERRKYPTPDDPDATPDLRILDCADIAPEVRRESGAESRETGAGTGEQGNRGTGEDDDPLPPEPAFDPGAEPNDVVVTATPPIRITGDTRPAKRHPSSAAMTVVRMSIGPIGADGYPRSTHERLAVQVEKLAAAGHADTLIRQALAEWDRRPNCTKPEFLPTVLSDVVKAARASPECNPHDAKVNSFLAYATPQRLEIPR